MEDIIEESKNVLNELYRFSSSIIHLGTSVKDDRLELFEKEIGYTLPKDFKYILSKHNGISLLGTEVLGIDLSFKGGSLDEVYKFEHFNVEHKMPLEFLPFSPDGRGNHYCLNLAKIDGRGVCPVVFWQWDYNYTGVEEVEESNESFLEWINEVMIEWKLEDYDYDGNEK
ncbi:SMI1/KNR4 family protein [Parapedobacter sp. DT-150]|uniref:SMI1/KNR4 family protein n=1 Tax=Parapedobacter sp. DT-150 TaxID=3396162 RepID=UPI003F1B5B12